MTRPCNRLGYLRLYDGHPLVELQTLSEARILPGRHSDLYGYDLTRDATTVPLPTRIAARSTSRTGPQEDRVSVLARS